MSTEVVPAVDAATARADSAAMLLDVREYDEWMAGHAEQAVHVPMSEVPGRLDELPRDRRIICICRSGNRSLRVASWLRHQGFDAVNLHGGMQRWAVDGEPLVNHAGRPGTVI